jgi:RNA polymerase sigma factor (sigma-70 family)
VSKEINIKQDSKDPYSDLVRECIGGKQQAQEEMYGKLSSKMFPVCLRYVGERERAKDVMHDGFITLFAKLGDFRGDGSFEGWARRIFVTTCLMYLRKNDVLKNSEQIDGEIPVIDIKLDPKETERLDAQTLMKVIAEMPAGFRTVFNLYVIEGYSHKEIAKMLKMSEGGSRNQLSRARVWLQEKLKNFKWN